jgi:hypothetical protein
MKIFLRSITLVSLIAATALAARYPIAGGPGLVHLQSAKTGSIFGFRSTNFISSYSGQQAYGLPGSDNSFLDLWGYGSVSVAPMPKFAIILGGVGHGEQWDIATPTADSTNSTVSPAFDKTLGCPGDFIMAAKYSFSLSDQLIDLAIMPMVSIPMDKDKYQDGPSQTGKLDFGSKILTDINLKQSNLYLNLGFMTRGDQRAQLPVGLGFEHGFNQIFSVFAELSAEMRVGSAKDSLPDSLIKSGRGYDRTEARFTPGIHIVPMNALGITLSADIGFSKATAPWQVILGVDFPSSAGRAISGIPSGAIAGKIKDRDTGVPMKGMITFPGTDIPGKVSDDIGTYLAELPPGDYKIHIYANGYRWLERKIKVEPGKKEKWDLTLKRKLGTIKGTVTDAVTEKPIKATLGFNGKDLPEFSSDPSTGEYNASVPPGKYDLYITAPGYQPQSLEVTARDKKEAVNDMALQPSATVAMSGGGNRRDVSRQTEIAAPQPPQAPKASSVTQTPRTEKPKPAATPKPAAAKMSADEVNDLYKSGVKQYMNEEYDKAVKTFQSVLKADPENAKAKDYLNKATDRLKKIRG